MGRLIYDRMSYRNHYMCSGEATSLYKLTFASSIVYGYLFVLLTNIIEHFYFQVKSD